MNAAGISSTDSIAEAGPLINDEPVQALPNASPVDKGAAQVDYKHTDVRSV